MQKQHILAVVLFIAIAIGSSMLSSRLAPTPEAVSPTPMPPVVYEAPDSGEFETFTPSLMIDEELEEQQLVIETDVFIATFSTHGAVMTSLRLKQFADRTTRNPVELVLPFSGQHSGAFSLYLSGDNKGQPFMRPFQVEVLDDGLLFYAETALMMNGIARSVGITKKYTLTQDEYLIRLEVGFRSLDEREMTLDFDSVAYTLEVMPQMGPAFLKLDARENFRHSVFLNAQGKRSVAKMRDGLAIADKDATWSAVVEKYFLVVGSMSGDDNVRQVWTGKPLDGNGLPGLQLNLKPEAFVGTRTSQVFHFYMGPKQERELLRYNETHLNDFGLSNQLFNRALDNNPILGPLIWVMRSFLALIYTVVPNWGWAIVILTVLVKIALIGPSLASAKSAVAMSQVQPKLKALQVQYKDKPQELSVKQMELYRKEGVNPAAGCLPLLVQMPILIALFSLFNQYFELRGAPWILWVTDLSAPDQLITFPNPIPLLGWQYLNLLPILYVATQLLTTMLTMNETAVANPQMKNMMWMMPIIFFFMLYNMPSGLFLYWTVSNVLGLGQQLVINHWKTNGKLEQMMQKDKEKKKAKSARTQGLMQTYQAKVTQAKKKK